MKKIILSLFLVIALIVFFVITSSDPAKTDFKSYYSGDALNYNGNLVVASTNSESLEVFSLENDGLQRQIALRPFDEKFHKDDSFYGVKLNIEEGHLYAYTISGFTIYKYDISDLNNAVLVKKVKNTYWEWYNKVDKFGDNIVTLSDRGVKVYNNNLELIDSYDLSYDIPHNITSAGHPNLIFTLMEDEGKIKVYDRGEREVISNLNVNFYGGENDRSMYYDSYDDNIYFADDQSVKKVGLNGALKGFFEHLGYPGYDVSSSGNEYLYFANGLGVVKLKKSDMLVVTSRRTGGITIDEGWAMGLQAVSTPEGEKIVVFNNSSLIVMNSNLEVLGYSVAGQEDEVFAKENLFLNLSSAKVDSGTQFQINGGGFFPEEELSLSFYGHDYVVEADQEGSFVKTLNAPDLKNSDSRDRVFSQSQTDNGLEIENITEKTDIKVLGNDSNYTYSIGLEINDLIVID